MVWWLPHNLNSSESLEIWESAPPHCLSRFNILHASQCLLLYKANVGELSWAVVFHFCSPSSPLPLGKKYIIPGMQGIEKEGWYFEKNFMVLSMVECFWKELGVCKEVIHCHFTVAVYLCWISILDDKSMWCHYSIYQKQTGRGMDSRNLTLTFNHDTLNLPGCFSEVLWIIWSTSLFHGSHTWQNNLGQPGV